jgi:hypothetical protein
MNNIINLSDAIMRSLATKKAATMTTSGVIIKKTPAGGTFQFRLVQQDRKTRPDIWRRNPDGKWVLLVSSATPADVQRYF